MRDVTGKGANKNYAPVRDDLPLHDMTGGNTFIPDLIETLWPDDGVDAAALTAGKARALDMLQHAASLDVAVAQLEGTVSVTITNETGHKLPSGYPEGRRMWIHLLASNSISGETYESGHYNLETAELTTEGTKIYHVKPGLSSTMAGISGLDEGPSFHFVLCDMIYFDNRIPPRGFTNDNFEAIQSPPVDYTYDDGQYWDITGYDIPFPPDEVEVTLYYQTTSKEYVEFLRDTNYTNDAGQVMYDLWEANGKSEPVAMNTATWTGPPVEPSSTFQLTAFLEGSYAGGTMLTTLNDQGALPLAQPFNTAPWNYNGTETVVGIPADIVDWLLLELRETGGTAADATGATIVGQKAVFLRSDGSIVDLDGESLPEFELFPDQDLYVVLWHRNHLGVMSAIPLERTEGVFAYDFSTGEGQAHGSADGHKDLGDGVWGLIAADANADGLVDDLDRSGSWMVQAGLAGYRSGDVNMDSQVNNPDKNSLIIENTGYSCQVPE
jgi:hypothetical protein